MKKLLFFVVWLLILILGPVTVFWNSSVNTLFISNSAIAHTAQRILGLTAFSLLFAQIFLGFFMLKLRKYLGDWIFKFHFAEGLLIYLLLISHGLAFVYFNYVIFQRFDPFYIFIDVCALCASRLDHYYNLGRIGFWFVTFAIAAKLLAKFNLYFRQNWRHFHYLNYFAFLVIGAHSYFVGTDIAYVPFKYFHVISLTVVGMISVYKLVYWILPKVRRMNSTS